MRLLRAFVLMSGLASVLFAAPRFSESLTPAQRERLGLTGLSATQVAELDAAVAAFQAPPSAMPAKPSAAAASAPVVAPTAAPRTAAPVAAKVTDHPVASASSRTSGVDQERITARVVGEFRGWSGGTYFPLENGQVWRQVGSDTNELPPQRDAVVEIVPSGNGYWRLRYDGAWITVRRLQ